MEYGVRDMSLTALTPLYNDTNMTRPDVYEQSATRNGMSPLGILGLWKRNDESNLDACHCWARMSDRPIIGRKTEQDGYLIHSCGVSIGLFVLSSDGFLPLTFLDFDLIGVKMHHVPGYSPVLIVVFVVYCGLGYERVSSRGSNVSMLMLKLRAIFLCTPYLLYAAWNVDVDNNAINLLRWDRVFFL